MRSTTAQADIAAAPAAVWAAITSPAQTPRFFAGLTITSAWQPDSAVDARHGAQHIATGAVVVADAPFLLVYRLENPRTGEVDCWLAWELAQTEPCSTRGTLTADTLPGDPPVDAVRLLSNLKTYLETARPLDGSPPADGSPA